MDSRGVWMAGGELNRLVEGLADELQTALWIRRYGEHMERLRSLSRPSEKLIYLFLVQSEPQSFTTIRRSLSLSSGTVDRAVRRLLELGCVVLDEAYLYWVSPPQQTRNP